MEPGWDGKWGLGGEMVKGWGIEWWGGYNKLGMPLKELVFQEKICSK